MDSVNHFFDCFGKSNSNLSPNSKTVVSFLHEIAGSVKLIDSADFSFLYDSCFL